MDAEMEKIIITEYENGKSSLQLAKLLGISKTTILKLLRKKDITRKRDRCQKLDIKKEGSIFYIERICPKCGIKIKTTSIYKDICCRNHFNAINMGSSCKPCSLEQQKGEGNPFYGKKHSKETLEKISKNRKNKAVGENNGMSKKENRDKIKVKLLERIKKNPTKYFSRSKTEKKIFVDIKKHFKDAKHSFVVNRYICDIFVPEINLIIEYNGDYWHCNPEKYESDYYHKYKKKTAKQIWEYDKNKIDLLIEKGYNYEIIWESDFNKDSNIINNLIKKYVQN